MSIREGLSFIVIVMGHWWLWDGSPNMEHNGDTILATVHYLTIYTNYLLTYSQPHSYHLMSYSPSQAESCLVAGRSWDRNTKGCDTRLQGWRRWLGWVLSVDINLCQFLCPAESRGAGLSRSRDTEIASQAVASPGHHRHYDCESGQPPATPLHIGLIGLYTACQPALLYQQQQQESSQTALKWP